MHGMPRRTASQFRTSNLSTDSMNIDTMPNQVTAVDWLGGHNLRLRFADGAQFALDFQPLVQRESGPLFDPLKCPDEFGKVRIDYGTLVFPTGYDICPDILRYWCEAGRVCTQQETDAFFTSALAAQKTA